MKIQELFSGLGRAHGVYTVKKTSTKDKKVSGSAATRLEPVTDELWQKHLSGEQGIGIIPINDDGVSFFGAIDVDVYPLNLTELEAKVNELALPLVVCRTKSGGAHLYVFIKDGIDSGKLRKKLGEWSYLLGHPGCEIFPKQSKLASENDVGNWINMPYFDAEKTTRYAIRNGKKLSLSQFEKFATAKRVTEGQIEDIVFEMSEALQESPPCLQALTQQGIPQGMRNTVLFNMGVYARLRYPDTWQEELDKFNQQYLSPALSSGEVQVITKSLNKKSYFYTCEHHPLCDVCDKGLCRTRKYGVGPSDDEPDLVLGTLVKIMTDPPIWVIDVDGVRMELSTEELVSQEKFRRRCMERVNKLPSRLKSKQWDDIINDRLTKCEIVEAPDDAGPEGMFWHLVRQFCTGHAQANTKEEMLSGKVWTDEGIHYFRSADLMTYLDRQRYKCTQRTAWGIIQKIEGSGYKPMTLKGVKTKVWYLPEFDKQDSDFTVPKAEIEV